MRAQIKKYETVDRWLTQVFSDGIRSESTEKTYLHFLARFCKFAGLNPDELIDVRRQHLRSTEELERRQHEELLIKWRNHLEEDLGLARGSVVTANNVIKSFYQANYVDLKVKAPKSWVTRVRKVPSPKELGLMIGVTRNNQHKAIMMCLAQSGVSLKDFRELITYGKVKDELESGVEPLHLPMERTKIKKKYDTFLGSDAIEFLAAYLKESSPKPNQPIFAISGRAIEYMVKRISIRAGFKPHVTPHRLRSFFNTYMVLSFHGAHTEHIPIVDYWMGHEIPYKGAYLVPPVEQQRKLYKEHEWAVSLPEK